MESNNKLDRNPQAAVNQDTDLKLQTQMPETSKKPLDYKALVPFIQYCPVTYKEFRKYSNINQLVKQLCERKHFNKQEERLILNRSYILFYLAPEHRNTAPINKIQVVENCPKHISDKFFNIPTVPYSKEHTGKPVNEQEVADRDQNVTKTTNNSEKLILDQARNETTKKQNCEALVLSQTQTASCREKVVYEVTKNAVIVMPLTQSQNVNSNTEKNEALPLATNNLESFTHNSEALPLTQAANVNCNTDSNDILPLTTENLERFTNSTEALSLTQEIQNTKCKDQSFSQRTKKSENMSLVQTQKHDILPVTLDEFKKYTCYEHLIDRLFKIVASGNENIYLKYKNSKESFDGTLINYYRAFYLIPVVRDKFPIQFRSTPKTIENRLFQIPQGVDVNAFSNIRAEQLVFPEFVEIKKELNDDDDDEDDVVSVGKSQEGGEKDKAHYFIFKFLLLFNIHVVFFFFFSSCNNCC